MTTFDPTDFETKILFEVKKFFESSQILTKPLLDKFLSELGLLEIWNSEEEKSYIWDLMVGFNKETKEVTQEMAIHGLKELFNPSEETTRQSISNNTLQVTNQIRQTITRVSTQKNRNSLTKFFKNLNADKIKQLRKFFSLINLQTKSSVTLSEIQDVLSKYKFIKIPIEELTDFLSQLCVKGPSNEEKQYKEVFPIDFGLYSKAISEMEQQILKMNNEFVNESQESQSDESYDITQDPIEMIDDLMNTEQETLDYLVAFGDVKNALKNYDNELIDNYNRIISNGDSADLRDNINHVNFLFDNKLKDIEIFIKDLSTTSRKKQNKLEFFKNSLNILLTNNKNLEEDYKQLYTRYNMNQPIEADDQMESLIEENKILTKKLEEKNAKIEKMEKESNEKEENANVLLSKLNDLKATLNDKCDEIVILKIDNDQLRKNYNMMVNDVLSKINEENTDSSKPVKVKVEERPENEKDAIREMESKMKMNERQKQICQLQYDKLLQYAINLDSSNETLNEKNDSLMDRIQQLEEEMKALKSNLNTEKENNIVLKSENSRMMKKIADLKEDAEMNLVFRPSNMINQIRLSRMSNMGNTITSNFNITSKDAKGDAMVTPFVAGDSMSNVRLSKIDISNKLNFGNGAMRIEKSNCTEAMTKTDKENVRNEAAIVLSAKNQEEIKEEDDENGSHAKKKELQITTGESPFVIRPSNMTGNVGDTDSVIIRGSTAIHNTNKSNVDLEGCINTDFSIGSESILKELASPTNSNPSSNLQTPTKKNPVNLSNLNTPSTNEKHLRNETLDDINLIFKDIKDNSHKAISGYDFLNLRKNQVIQDLLEKTNDISNSYEMFSDNVFVLESNYKKRARIIFITCNYIYILKQRDLSVKQKFNRNLLQKFTIATSNCNMIAFHFSKGEGLVIDILRRLELLYYFRDLYKLKGYGKIAFKYSDLFNIIKDGKYVTIGVKLSNDAVTQNFSNAIKLDYLMKMTSGFFSYSFSEKLVVLTSIGLLYFDDPTKPPKKLIPIIGSKIEKCEESKYGRKFCFEIVALNKEHIVFAAKTEEDLNSWLSEFDKMKKSYENNLKVEKDDK